MQTVESDLAVSAKTTKTKRILAFDLIRGFFLVVIMIDHVELYPSGWSLFTGEGRLWVSAAAGFFFLSGLITGIIYRRRLTLGIRFIFRKMWRRALQLYIVGTGLTVFYIAWVQITHHPPIKDNIPMPFPWHHYIWSILNTHFTYGWADFLVHFVPLMIAAPFVFWLAASGLWWVALLAIIGVWRIRGTSFNFAWQILFNLGILVGFYWQQITDRFYALTKAKQKIIKRSFAAVAGITLAASYSSVYILSQLNEHLLALPAWLQHVTHNLNHYNAEIWKYAHKWTMGPLRITLFLIWFPVLYWVVRKYETQINRATRGILELLGRNSLFVYAVHSFIIFAMKMYLIPETTNLLQNFLITTFGLALLVLITKFYRILMEKYKLAEQLKEKAASVKNSLNLSFEKS